MSDGRIGMIMVLVKRIGMQNCGAVNWWQQFYCLQTYTIAQWMDQHTKIKQGSAEVNHLINTCVHCNELRRTIGGGLDCWLLLWIPVNGSLVEQMQNPSNGMSNDDVIVKVGIEVVNRVLLTYFPSGLRAASGWRKHLGDIQGDHR